MKVEVTIYVSERLRTRLRLEAARTGQTISAICGDAIARNLDRRSSARSVSKGRKSNNAER